MRREGEVDAKAAARALRREALKKLTRAEWKALHARNMAIAPFLIDSNAAARRMLEEEGPSSIDPRSTPEWRAALARILDTHPLPESMLQAGVQDSMRKYTFPVPQYSSSSPQS